MGFVNSPGVDVIWLFNGILKFDFTASLLTLQYVQIIPYLSDRLIFTILRPKRVIGFFFKRPKSFCLLKQGRNCDRDGRLLLLPSEQIYSTNSRTLRKQFNYRSIGTPIENWLGNGSGPLCELFCVTKLSRRNRCRN